MPEDSERDESYLLREAVELVWDAEWSYARQTFHAGQLHFVQDGLIDYDSIKTAVEALAKAARKLHKLAPRRNIWPGVRRAISSIKQPRKPFAPIIPFAAGQVVASNGQLTAGEILGNRADPSKAGALARSYSMRSGSSSSPSKVSGGRHGLVAFARVLEVLEARVRSANKTALDLRRQADLACHPDDARG